MRREGWRGSIATKQRHVWVVGLKRVLLFDSFFHMFTILHDLLVEGERGVKKRIDPEVLKAFFHKSL